MTWDTRNGRSVETVQAELRAIEARTVTEADPALHAVVDRLRGEHEEARRARRRELEDDLMTMPGGERSLSGGIRPNTAPTTRASAATKVL